MIDRSDRRGRTLRSRDAVPADRASDEQRVDNCKVPPERRGPKHRPDTCANDAGATPKNCLRGADGRAPTLRASYERAV
jgi:hypothetical protein